MWLPHSACLQHTLNCSMRSTLNCIFNPKSFCERFTGASTHSTWNHPSIFNAIQTSDIEEGRTLCEVHQQFYEYWQYWKHSETPKISWAIVDRPTQILLSPKRSSLFCSAAAVSRNLTTVLALVPFFTMDAWQQQADPITSLLHRGKLLHWVRRARNALERNYGRSYIRRSTFQARGYNPCLSGLYTEYWPEAESLNLSFAELGFRTTREPCTQMAKRCHAARLTPSCTTAPFDFTCFWNVGVPKLPVHCYLIL